MSRRVWLIPIAALGGAILWNRLRQIDWEQVAANIRRFGLPSAAFYESFTSGIFDGLFDEVIARISRTYSTGDVLEIGCGPGYLAVRMAGEVPGIKLTALDISPDMVERARLRARKSGMADRIRFEVADVGAMPFPDQHFDLIVSTFSLHHWAEPARGLSEIYRVLRPGGEAHIYDIVDWLLHAYRYGDVDLSSLVAETPFRQGAIEPSWRVGPVPIARLLTLRRE